MIPHLMGTVKGKQTNNRAELTAIYKCIEATLQFPRPLHIYTDSQYSINSISKFCRVTMEDFAEAVNYDKVLNLDIISDIVNIIRQRLPNKVFIS